MRLPCRNLRALLPLSTALLCTVGTGSLFAQVHVSPSGTDAGDGRNPAAPVATVGYALQQANPGEEVRLAVGTYTESGLEIPQSQVVTGGWPADFSPRPGEVVAANTTIDGELAGRVLYVGFTDAAQEVVLDGFRIHRGDADASSPSPGHGGGILALGPGALTLENIRITDSRAKSTRPEDLGEGSHAKGGGIYADCSLVISNSTILNNRAHRGALNSQDLATGGGIYYDFHGMPGRTLMIVDSSITSNVAQSSQTQSGTARGLGAGGGLAVVGSDPESGEVAPEAVRIENTRFNLNSGRQLSDPGPGEAGGLYVNMTGTTTGLELQIVDSRFENNTAANTPGFTTFGLWTRGGGASILLNAQSAVTVEDSLFTGNRADAQFVGTVASGGAIYVESTASGKGGGTSFGSMLLKATQFRNNRASQGSSTAGGGAIHSSNTELTIESSQFSGNGNHNEEPFPEISGNDGKDLLVNGGTKLRIVNSSFTNPHDLEDHLLLAGKGDSVFVSGDVDAEFIHCTFARTTETALAALHFDTDVEALIDSCLIHNYANVARFDGSSDGDLDFNVHTSPVIATGVFTQTNNHTVDTEESEEYFVDLPGNNVRLVAGAFPIGKANPNTGVTTDQDNNPRDEEPDCGAFEWVQGLPALAVFQGQVEKPRGSTVIMDLNPDTGDRISTTIRLVNVGDGDLEIIAMSGFGPFEFVSLAGEVLEPGDQSGTPIDMTTNTRGLHEGTLTILTNDPEEIYSVFLQGYIPTGVATVQVLEVESTESVIVTADPVELGGRLVFIPIIIVNTGDAKLPLFGIDCERDNGDGTTGPCILDTDELPEEVPPGESGKFSVGLPASTPGTFTIRLSIPHEGDPNQPNPIPVNIHYEAIFTPAIFDYGDAPESYTTLLIDDGPRHNLTDEGETTPLWLGQVSPDAEPDGQPTGDARGDDESGTDDEDGLGPRNLTLALPNDCPPTNDILVADNPASRGLRLTVNGEEGAAGFANLWMDFDRDGRFDIAERLQINPDVEPGPAYAATPGTLFFFDIPFTAPTTGNIIPRGSRMVARARVSTDQEAVLKPFGWAPDGEVEDHIVRVVEFADPALTSVEIAQRSSDEQIRVQVFGHSTDETIAAVRVRITFEVTRNDGTVVPDALGSEGVLALNTAPADYDDDTGEWTAQVFSPGDPDLVGEFIFSPRVDSAKLKLRATAQILDCQDIINDNRSNNTATQKKNVRFGDSKVLRGDVVNKLREQFGGGGRGAPTTLEEFDMNEDGVIDAADVQWLTDEAPLLDE